MNTSKKENKKRDTARPGVKRGLPEIRAYGDDYDEARLLPLENTTADDFLLVVAIKR
jgi:hypothetical protein